jgi:hypothetical protein
MSRDPAQPHSVLVRVVYDHIYISYHRRRHHHHHHQFLFLLLLLAVTSTTAAFVGGGFGKEVKRKAVCTLPHDLIFMTPYVPLLLYFTVVLRI